MKILTAVSLVLVAALAALTAEFLHTLKKNAERPLSGIKRPLMLRLDALLVLTVLLAAALIAGAILRAGA